MIFFIFEALTLELLISTLSYINS